MTFHSKADYTLSHKIGSRRAFGLSFLGAMRDVIDKSVMRFRRRRQVRINRAAFQQMLLLDDDLLDDIGVTRANVEWASQLPIELSAAQALNETRKRARPKIRP